MQCSPPERLPPTGDGVTASSSASARALADPRALREPLFRFADLVHFAHFVRTLCREAGIDAEDAAALSDGAPHPSTGVEAPRTVLPDPHGHATGHVTNAPPAIP